MWFLFGLIALESIADIFAKKYGMEQKAKWFILSLMGYVLANASWLMYMVRHNKLAWSANVFSVSSGILAVIIGVYFYGEVLTITQMLGIILGVISLCLLFF